MKLLQLCITCWSLLIFSASYTQSGWVTDKKDGRLKYVYKPEPVKPSTNTTPQKYPGRPAKKEKDPVDPKYYPAKGIYKTADKGTYEGDYQYNTYIRQRHGFGKCVFDNGNIYEGNWLADKMHGKGTYTVPYGRIYTGEWNAGKFVGEGTFNSDILGVKDDAPVKTVTPTPPAATSPNPYAYYPPPAFTATSYDTLIKKEMGGKYGFADRNGIFRIEPIYQYVSEFVAGYAVVMMEGKIGYIDVWGKVVVPLIYESTGYMFREGLSVMKLNGKWGFVNTKGANIIPFKYEKASSFSEGLAAVSSGGKQGYIDKTGKVVIPFKYEETGLNMFVDGVALVKLGTGYGYINKKGVEIIPAIYDNAYPYQDGKIYLVLNGLLVSFDKTGKKISQ